jgi:hypothetical protein
MHFDQGLTEEMGEARRGRADGLGDETCELGERRLQVAVIVPAVLDVDRAHSRLIAALACVAILAQRLRDLVMIEHFRQARVYSSPPSIDASPILRQRS